MTINRIKAATTQPALPSGASGWAFLSGALPGSTLVDFIATGADGTVAGATYRVVKFDTVGTWDLTFDRVGRFDFLIAAGGGGGGGNGGDSGPAGGGGAGGLVRGYGYSTPTVVKVVVGDKGVRGQAGGIPTSGGNSSIGPYVAYGGGRGSYNSSVINALSGGSGGGSYGNILNGQQGRGVPGQGNDGAAGATASTQGGGGGGGAGGAGIGASSLQNNSGGNGGSGALISFDGAPTWFCAGGGGASNATTSPGGVGGGNTLSGGGNGAAALQGAGTAATSYGSGGGGGGWTGAAQSSNGGDGFRGIVMVRFRVS